MFLTTILLLLALVCTFFAARATVSAVQSFQQQNTLMKQGDVHTIRPWMTIPYIAHVYKVPESYLYASLHLSDTHALHHSTLQALALRNHSSVDEVIRTIQGSILLYRREHREHVHVSFLPVSQMYCYLTVGRATTA